MGLSWTTEIKMSKYLLDLDAAVDSFWAKRRPQRSSFCIYDVTVSSSVLVAASVSKECYWEL